jgi:polyphosphate kinase
MCGGVVSLSYLISACVLYLGLKGFVDKIRYLENARIFWFKHDSEDLVWIIWGNDWGDGRLLSRHGRP